jgi:bla regulator protein BlaR1
MRLLETLGHWTWQTSLAACVLIIPALLAQALLRGPRFISIRHLLGLLIVARLLLPFTPQSAFSILNLFSKQAEIVSQPIPTSTAVQEITPVAETAPKPHLHVLPLLWMAGVMLILARIGIQHSRLRRAIKRSQPIANEMLPRRVALYALPKLSTPALFGFFRPAILIPSNVLATASPQTLRLIVLHELAHWRRFDVPINWLIIFAQALHWFNPLVWFAMRRLRAEQELLCDRDVMRQLEPTERQSYGETLLALASPASLPISTAIPLSSSFKQMKERIAMITQFKPTAQRALLIALPALAAVVATLTFTAAVPSRHCLFLPLLRRQIQRRRATKGLPFLTSNGASLRSGLNRCAMK